MSQRRSIYFTAAALSLLLSLWACIRQSVINPDAICYLLSAESMPLGLSYAAHLCGQAHWPFYSILIYGVASFSKLSYEYSAYLLNGLFSLISVLTFVAIVRFLKGTTRTLWLAAFVILLAHEFNAVREYIIRDHGFWAFYLLSILFLLKCFHKQRWCYALAWSVSLIVATLFRIEGLFFLLVLPFVALFFSGQDFHKRILLFLKLNALTFVSVCVVAGWFLLHAQQNIEQLGRLGEITYQLQHGFSAVTMHFKTSTDILSQYVLSKYAAHDASLILFLTLISWYVIHVVMNLSPIYAVLVVYAWCKRSLPLNKSAQWILWSYIFINVVITAIFLLEHMFLSKRYLLALSLTFMLWIPFALNHLCDQWQQRKWPLLLAALFIMICAYSGVYDRGSSKTYKRDAGQWLEKNLPKGATLYSNDYQIMYYSNQFGNTIFSKAPEFLKQNTISIDKKYDYVALRIDKKRAAKSEVLEKEVGQPIKIFMNKRGDQVAIYKQH